MRLFIVSSVITLVLGAAGSASAELEEISPNSAPVASATSLLVAEDGSVDVLAQASDDDGDAVSFVVTTPPSHGALSGVGPDWTYTPLANYHGSDAFTFVASDGQSASPPVTVDIEVAPVADAPSAADAAVATDEDAAMHVELGGVDADGDAVSFSIVSGPSHGQLSGHAPQLVYTPDANYSGSDSFSFVASDGELTSAPATIQIDVAPVNDAPVAGGAEVSVDEDGSTPVLLAGVDVDGDAVTWTVVSGPEHGTVTGTAPALVYWPTANYFGRDSIVFVVNDGQTDSSPAEIDIVVAPVADAPFADDLLVGADEDSPVSIALSGQDVDGDAVSYIVVGAPTHGTITGAGRDRVYTPNADFHGADSFTYVVADEALASEPATVEIFVAPVNDPPQTAAASLAVTEDQPLNIELTGTDVDGDALEFTVIVGPASGQLLGTPPHLTYVPAQDFSGTDSFTYNATDGTFASAPTLVTLNVASVNDAPRVAASLQWSATEDTTLSITLPGTDADGDALTFTVTAPPAHGTFEGSGPNRVYQPAPDFFGTDVFAYTVFDGTAITGQQVGTITVVGTPDAPVAKASTYAIDAEQGLTFELAASDADGDAINFEVVSDPANGWIDGQPPTLFYRPFNGFSGTDQLVFQVSDGLQVSAAQTVTFVVASPVTDETASDDDSAPADSDDSDAADDHAVDQDEDEDEDGTVAGDLGSGVLIFCPDTIEGAPCDSDRWQPLSDQHGTPSEPVHFTSFLPADLDDFRLVYWVRHGRDLDLRESDLLREFTAERGGRVVITVDRDNDDAVDRVNRWLDEEADLGVRFAGGDAFSPCLTPEDATIGAALASRPLFLDIDGDRAAHEVVAATDDGVLAVTTHEPGDESAMGDFVLVADESALAGTCGDNHAFIDALYTFEPLATCTNVDETPYYGPSGSPSAAATPLTFTGGCAGGSTPTTHLAWLLAVGCLMVRARRRRVALAKRQSVL